MHSPIRSALAAAAACCALHPACSAAVRTHTLTFPKVTDPMLRTPILVPGFDPALGTLRCIDIAATVAWTSAGEVGTLNLNSQPFLATVSVGEISDIGYEDSDTFITVAGVIDGVQFDVQHPEGVISHDTPFMRSGSGSHDTHVMPGDPGFDRFMAAGDIAFMLERIPDEAVLAPPPPPDPFIGIVSVTVEESHVETTYTITYHYLPVVDCGDANDDGVCDFLDLNIVLSDYGGDLCSSGDLDGNGVCDFLDLNNVLSYFGFPCPR